MKGGTKIDKEFMEKVMTAYIETGKCIQKKLPLENETLETISFIDPKVVASSRSEVLEKLLKLPKLFSGVLKDEDKYAEEIRQLRQIRPHIFEY